MVIACLVGALGASAAAIQPPAPTGQPPASGAQPPAGRGGGRGGRPPIAVMRLTSAWPDGAAIPARFAQGGGEQSPPLEWADVPDGVVSFVLVVHDLDVAIGSGSDDMLHWLVWNIPAAERRFAANASRETIPGSDMRQIGATGPAYRGPGAAADGQAHHYAFELYALDATIDVAAVGMSPPQTRAAVIAAMGGHVRGKAVLVGLFKRP